MALLTSSIQQHYSDDKTDFTEHVTDPSRSYQQHTTMFVPSTQKSQEGPEFVQRQDCNSLYISQPAGDLRGQYIQNDGFSQIQYMGGENRTTEQQGRTDRVQLPIQIPPTTGSRFSLQQQPNFGTEVNMQPRLSLNQEHKHEFTSRTGSNSMLLCQEEINKSVILTDEGGPTHLYQQDIRKGSFAPDVESPYQQDNYIGNHPPTESDQRNLFRQNIYEGNLPTAEANPRRLHQQQINVGVLSSAERDHMRPYQQQYNEAIPSPEADPRRMYQPQINDGNLQTAEADHRRLYQPQKNEGVLQSVQADSRRRYQPQIHDRYLPTAEADHMGSNQQPQNEGVLSSTDLDNRHLYQQQMNARNLPPVLDPTCQYQRQMHESVHPHAEGDPTRFFPQQINEGVQSPAGGDSRFLQPLRDPRLPYQYTRSNFSQTQQPRLNFAQTQPRYGYMPQRALLQGQVSQHQHRNVLHPGPNFGGQLQQLPTFRQDYQMEMARQEQYQIQQTGYDQYSRHPPQYGYYENRYGYQQPEVSVHGYLVGDQFIGPTSWNCRMEHHSQHNSLQALEQTDISTDNLIAIRKDINSDEEYSGKTKKLKVSKIPKSSTKDTLKAFFENTRKFGGGDIESINYDKKKSTAIITFKGDDGVETVLNKKPISFGDTIVEVEAYLPDELLKNEDPDSDEYNTPPESDSDDESVCAIEVSGLKKATTENTIKFYFEGKNGADADIKKIKRIKENNMYLVTFKNAAAVNTVMEKTHRIDGAELHVKKHVSPKRYRNKVLVSGLNDNTSTDRLMLFFEAKAKTDVETVLLGEEESRKAIVTFAEIIDIDEIQMTIIDKLCEGKSLKVQPVEVSNCIIGRGYSEETTCDDIELYFDNEKKSGVQGVTECTMNEEENYFVVYFEDPKDAIVAAQREHTLRGHTISVQLFHDCLGIPVDLHESKFKPLPPVTVENIDKQMVKFMMQSNTSNKELQNHLQSIHAEVHWPTSDDGKVTIHSTLSTSIKEWRKISKTWKEDVLKQFDILIDQLAVNQQTTLQDAWNQVVDKMAQIVTPYSDNLILIFEKQPACEIYIVGIKSDVAKVSQRIKEIIHDITEELNMKKQQMTEEVQLKHHQLLILELTNFPNEVKKKFDNIGVSIDKKNLKITFEGIFNSVLSSKLEMYEFIGNMSSTLLGSRSPEFIHFLDNANVKESVLKRMKDQQCIGVWEVHNRNIILYSTSDEEVSKAADVFKDSIIENTVAIENIQHSVLNSKKWTHHVKDIESKCCQKSVSVEMVADKQGNIVVLCTSKAECVSIKEGIQEFFDLNTEMKETLQFEKYEFMFLQEHMQDEVENLVMQLKQRNIIVWFKSDHVLVKANEEGIRDAKKRITALIKTIYRGEHSLDKAGLHKLMESDKGNNKLKQIGRKAGVLFITESNISSSKEEAKPRTSSDRRVTFSAAGGQKIIVIQGDITELSVDVIVNAAKSDLIHNGGLAKVLINKGGKGIQLECNQFTKTHGQLSAGEVFCSEPGSLHCKHIIHAVGPKWQGGRNKEEDYLRDCVAASLVETDKRHLSSIAIPALCTGRFAYPASEATNVITESVRDYLKKTKSSCIKKVFLCDIVTDTVDLFIKAGNELFNQHGYATYKKGRQVITTGKIKISIKKEELAKMKVDAIVNTTSKDLQLGKGTVSASLLNNGGSDLQKECSKKYPNGVNYGEVAVTSGAKLQSKIVCHVSLEKWEDDSSIKVFEKTMMSSLQTADKKGFRSIAFPAMGTGKLNYPRDLVAKHMYKCVDDFSSKNPKSTITEVFFVLYHKDHLTVQAFENQEKLQQKYTVEHEKPTTFLGKGNKNKHEDDKVYSTSLGKVVLKLYKGDITAVPVEVIVNSSNTNLDLSLGEVSKAILQKGGPNIKKQLLRQKTDMKNDGIAVTACKGSGLICDIVIHVDMQDTTLKLKEKITHVLDKAEELCKISVAFPALGTSSANITVKEAAEEMYSAVNQFQSKSLEHVKEVHVVIFKNDQMRTFMETIKACVGTGKKKGWMACVRDYAKDLRYGANSDNKPKILTEDRPKKSSEKKSTGVIFVIYAKNKLEAEKAVTVLETELYQEYVSKKIEDRIVPELKPEQIDALKFIGKSENVEIHVDKRNKEIVLTGIIDNISSAMSATNKIIKTAIEEKQLNQKAKLVTDMVQWSFVEEKNGKKTFVEFPYDVNLLLEEAFKDNSSKVTFLASDGSKMIIDLTSYKMFPEDDPTDENGIIRKTKLVSDSDFKPPEHWDDMVDNDEYIKIVTLAQSSKEYKSVLTHFNKTGGASYTVVKIDRIQNKVLNQQYIAKKKLMDATNPPGYQNERRPVWHGTNKQAIENIINTGFNRSYGKVTAYGKGVYFAVNVSYSASGNYASGDPTDGLKRMLMCKVLAGEFTVGNKEMRTPPPKTQAGAGSYILYDSTTNDVSNPEMFVTYHDSQAVAEYLVTFK